MFGLASSKRVKELEKEIAEIKKQIRIVAYTEEIPCFMGVLTVDTVIEPNRVIAMLMAHQGLAFNHTPDSITLVKEKKK